MSTIQVSARALQGVRNKLQSSFFWNRHNLQHPVSLYKTFAGTSYKESEEVAKRRIDEFIRLVIIFNATEYDRGKCPDEEYVNHWMKLSNGDCDISIHQFYKTMLFIDYNTEAEGWIDENEPWIYRAAYKGFKQQVEEIINYLANHIAAHTKEVEDAKWDL